MWVDAKIRASDKDLPVSVDPQTWYFLDKSNKKQDELKLDGIIHKGNTYLTARRRGSKKTFDGTLLLHYEKSCQNAFEQCLNLFKPLKKIQMPSLRLPPP